VSYFELYAHLIWRTNPSTPLVSLAVEREVWALLASRCQLLKATPIQIGGMPDHVHVLVRFPTALPLARLAGELKGATSYQLTRTILPGAPFSWQEGYGAFTLRTQDVAPVVRYIENQRQHHQANRLSAFLERTGDEREAASGQPLQAAS